MIKMVIANRGIKNVIEDSLNEFAILDTRNLVVVQSPLLLVRNGEDILIDVFPLWIEYYNSLSNPFKIIVIGINWTYRHLPYFLCISDRENTWDAVERLIKTNNIDYANVPEKYFGKGILDVFFHGHGEENVKGVLGKIADFVRNGIQMLKEGENLNEIREIFFEPARKHLEKFKERIQKYRPLLQYLPWEKEIIELEQMTKTVETFIGNPVAFNLKFDETVMQINIAVSTITELMRIHKIKEK